MGLDIYIETQPKNDLNNEASRKQVGVQCSRWVDEP